MDIHICSLMTVAPYLMSSLKMKVTEKEKLPNIIQKAQWFLSHGRKAYFKTCPFSLQQNYILGEEKVNKEINPNILPHPKEAIKTISSTPSPQKNKEKQTHTQNTTHFHFWKKNKSKQQIRAFFFFFKFKKL